MRLSDVIIQRPLKIALGSGCIGGFLLILINTRSFQEGSLYGYLFIGAYVFAITLNLSLYKLLINEKIIYQKRVFYSNICFWAANVPFLIFEILFTQFAKNKTFINYIKSFLTLFFLGLIISLIVSIFIRRTRFS